MHIGWGDHFSLWEERLFVEGVEALSVLQGLGSGLPLKMYWTWESYCDSSKVSHRGGQKSVIGNTILKEHVFFCICICFIVTWNDQFITFFYCQIYLPVPHIYLMCLWSLCLSFLNRNTAQCPICYSSAVILSLTTRKILFLIHLILTWII